MKITVFGVGFVGSALVRELNSRRHDVIAVSRHPGADVPSGVVAVSGSVHDRGFLQEVTAGANVLVSALPAGTGSNALDVSSAVLLSAAEAVGARLGVVGGSAVLPLVEGGPPQAGTPGFPAWLIPRAQAHQRTLDLLRSAPEHLDWFYLVPAAEFGPHQPGVRTGLYRTSSTAQVTDEDGRSTLGVEDYAIAFADEIDSPKTHRTWLAVGY
ncbi:NAD(P)-dependent oxidoreductase [Amycolatopsis sacchari]|uniref:NAD(P)-dependent oxidoreductase n=1 Tax=Amycolatopsis sacchari TaxID=115433 RepID=UPI003EB9F30B